MNTLTIAPELHMAERALNEADDAIDAYWSRPTSDFDSRLADAETAISALMRGFVVMLALLERQERRN